MNKTIEVMKRIKRMIISLFTDCAYALPFILILALVALYLVFDFSVIAYVVILLSIYILNKPYMKLLDKKFKKYEKVL